MIKNMLANFVTYLIFCDTFICFKYIVQLYIICIYTQYLNQFIIHSDRFYFHHFSSSGPERGCGERHTQYEGEGQCVKRGFRPHLGGKPGQD